MPKADRYRVDLPSIQRRLPNGFKLPRTFVEFATWCRGHQRGSKGWFRLEGTNPDSLVGAKVGKALSPFMVLPDGGFVAFWFEGRKVPAVVWLDSEGQSGVAGASWDDFLRRLAVRKTGVFDLDDQSEPPTARKKARPAPPLGAIKTAFKRWLKAQAPKPEKVSKADGERARAMLVKACKPYWRGEPAHLRWTNFIVTLSDRVYNARWYKDGLNPVPDAERMRPAFTALREALGKPLTKAKIVVWGDGTVIVGPTVLEPPKKAAR